MASRDVAGCAAELRPRYQAAGRAEKGRLLTRFCEVTGYHRKAAIRLLGPRGPSRRTGRGPGRPRRYDAAARTAAVTVWEASGRLTSKNLVPYLPTLVEQLERHGELALEPAPRAALLALSAATLDRTLRPHRRRLGRQPRAGAGEPGSLKAQVPVRTFGDWADVAPGAVQADLVLLCGETTAGHYLTVLVTVDVATSWCGLRAVWGKTYDRVGAALWHTRAGLPFPLRELHTDNGSEFLNDGLVRWCRKEGIRYTRGRPYKKNDQAWGEQKNWVAVRKLIGYDRYSTRAAHAQLGRVLALAADYLNFCRPVRKLVSKERDGARVRKRYDTARTPYQRLLAAKTLTAEQRAAVETLAARINPVALRARLDHELRALWALADPPAGRALGEPGL